MVVKELKLESTVAESGKLEETVLNRQAVVRYSDRGAHYPDDWTMWKRVGNTRKDLEVRDERMAGRRRKDRGQEVLNIERRERALAGTARMRSPTELVPNVVYRRTHV